MLVPSCAIGHMLAFASQSNTVLGNGTPSESLWLHATATFVLVRLNHWLKDEPTKVYLATVDRVCPRPKVAPACRYRLWRI